MADADGFFKGRSIDRLYVVCKECTNQLDSIKVGGKSLGRELHSIFELGWFRSEPDAVLSMCKAHAWSTRALLEREALVELASADPSRSKAVAT